MKRSSTIFLQAVVVFIGIGALAFLLGEPHVEGANARATFFEVYFDPFVAYVYLASVPFFVALGQAFKLLGCVGRNDVFSQRAVRALRTIKCCAITVIGFVAISVIFMAVGDPEDRPPGVAMRAVVTLLLLVVASAASVFEWVLQRAVEMKSENELTV